jgi:hypothetical protein
VFTRELKRIDPLLEMVWISDPKDGTEAPFGIVWNRWHVIRHNPATIPSFIPIVDNDGGYVEPTSRVFDMLQAGDLWNGEAYARARKRQAKAAADRARDQQDFQAEIRDELEGRLKAMENPGVSMSGRWTARAGARSG